MRGYMRDRKAYTLFVLGNSAFLLSVALKDAPVLALHIVAGFCLGMSIPLLLGSVWRKRKISGKPQHR